MEYQIHDRKVVYDGNECGIYKSPGHMLRLEYAIMDVDHLIKTINDMPKSQAIEAVTVLKDKAAKYVALQHTPQNPGFPILRQIPGPSTEIGEVRKKIMNTEKLCNEILKTLKGE
mgnify:CR=1 FL=1